MCYSYILNLVIKDGLKDLDLSIVKVRVEEEKIECKGLVCLDIETRWNSTYLRHSYPS